MKLLILTVFLLWRLPHQCSASDSIQIYPKETFFGENANQVILTCQPSQSCGDTIKWFKGQSEVDTSSSKYSTAVNYINNHQTLTVYDAVETDAGSYHCQCTFNSIAMNSPTAAVIHKNPVSFSNEDNQIYYAEFGKNVTLICEIENYMKFQWQKPISTVIPDNNVKYTYVGHNLTISNLTINDNHTFLCVGNNEITFAATLTAHVFVYKSPEVISTSSTDMSVDEGDSITFNCTAEGHPRPKINWLRTDGQLKTGATVIVNEGDIDQFTQWSSLTLTHISDSDKGKYLCSATSETPKQSGADTATFTLTVNEPVNPLFQIFTIDKSHSSINISWLLSGVDSNMINVSWSTSNDVLHQVHSSNLSSIVLMDLVPDTLYLINAFVIGTDLYAGLNESTNQLETTSSSTVQETSTSTQIAYSTTTNTLTPPIFTTTASDFRGTDTPHSTLTARPTQTTKSTMEPSQTTELREVSGDNGGISSETVIVATVVLVSLVIVMLVVLLILFVIVKKSRRSRTKNIRSIEKARCGSSRSSQVLLDPQTSINSQMSSPSIHSNTAASSDMPPGYFEGTNYIPPHSINCNSQGSTNSPLYSGPNSQIKLPMSNEFVYTAAASQNEPFEMTDNPNFGVQLSQIPPVLGGGNIPSMTYNEYCSDCPPYSGDSVSQVIASQSSNVFDSRQNHQFQYTDSTVYEMTSPYKKSQSEPPQQPTSTNLPIYSNQNINSNVKKPEFGIVGNSQRGAVRENVVIKKR